jgi:polyisoprenyl-phosphate glycosyltransferase
MLISIVVPVYKEEKTVPEFLARVAPILSKITSDFEIIFSMDPSPDCTEDVIMERRSKDNRIKLIKFSRRFGQPMAILAGLQYATGDAVIVMDVDLQDPPELITGMVAKWKDGYDVVSAQRRSREGETWLKRVVTTVGYKLINLIADVNIPLNTGDFRLMSRRVVNQIGFMKESHGFLRGMVAVAGFNQTSILFDRPARFEGEGNYNRFFGSLRIGFNGIFCFSTYALTLSTIFGFITVGFSFLFMAIYLACKLVGKQILWDNPTLVILISFLGGIQLISLGILGAYIGRIYEEVRARPKFIVDRSVGFEGHK